MSHTLSNDPALPAPARRVRLATSIESAGSSGVIDVAAMRMATQSDLAGPPAAPLATRRLIAGTADARPIGPAPEILYGAVGLLACATAVLGFLALRAPATVVVERDASRAGSLSVSAVESTVSGGETIPGSSRTNRPTRATRAQQALDVEAVDVDAAAQPASAEPDEVALAETSPPSRSKTTSSRKAKARPATATAPTPASTTPVAAPPKAVPEPAPKPARAGDANVECILDPASCKPASPDKPAAPKPAAPATSLPQKLSMTALRTGLAGPKNAAKVCGSMHAIAAGTKIQIKLSIAGETGEVTRATPLAPFANDAGRCVADKLADATFEPFGAAAMGVVYGVIM